jgi:hypothetical protein
MSLKDALGGLAGRFRLRDGAWGLLLFGIYTTERFKWSMGGVSLRYSLVALVGLSALAFFREPRAWIIRTVRDPWLSAWFPFLGLSAISVMLSANRTTAVLVWGWNALTLVLCADWASRRSWREVRLPWLVALLGHAGVILWDEFCIAEMLPRAWALGNLFPTYGTFRPAGFYVAPQFTLVALACSGFIWLLLDHSERPRFRMLPFWMALGFVVSRTGLVLKGAILALGHLFGNFSREGKQRWQAILFPWLLGNLATLGFLVLLSPAQGKELRQLFGLQQTWARVCPWVGQQFPRWLECPDSEVPLPHGNPVWSSEGKRIAEWDQVAEDLRERPFFGHGYLGVAENLLAPEHREAAVQKRVQYRYESVWATMTSYYGVLGLLALGAALVLWLRKLQRGAGAVVFTVFWVIGAHSSHVFARLDLWLPFFLLANLGGEESPVRD